MILWYGFRSHANEARDRVIVNFDHFLNVYFCASTSLDVLMTWIVPRTPNLPKMIPLLPARDVDYTKACEEEFHIGRLDRCLHVVPLRKNLGRLW